MRRRVGRKLEGAGKVERHLAPLSSRNEPANRSPLHGNAPLRRFRLIAHAKRRNAPPSRYLGRSLDSLTARAAIERAARTEASSKSIPVISLMRFSLANAVVREQYSLETVFFI